MTAPAPRGDTAASVLFVSAEKGSFSGQAIYESELLKALDMKRPGLIYAMVVGSRRSASADVRLPTRLQLALPYAVRSRLGSALYPRHTLLHRLDLRCPPRPGEVLTVHDLAPLAYDDEGRLPADAITSIRHARAVISVSAFSADEIRRHTGRSDVHVIPNGVEPLDDVIPMSDEELAALGVHSPFVLNVGGTSKRKNLDGLAAAWQIVASADCNVRLVTCGPGRAVARTFDGVPGVVVVDIPERGQLLRLMARAQAAVVPSVYEGFGRPAIEAMACGVPVVASDRSSLPEVCGDAAVLVGPDPLRLADGILRALVRDTELDRMVRRGVERARTFTWTRVAEEHLALYDSLAPGP